MVSSLRVTLQSNAKRSRVSWRLRFYWFCWYELVFGMGGLGFCWTRGILKKNDLVVMKTILCCSLYLNYRSQDSIVGPT